MDLNKLNKGELEALLNDVIDATVDELVKAQGDHNTPGLADDFAESDAVAEANGATAKAMEDEEPKDDDDEDKEKKSEDKDEDDKEDEKEEKSNKDVANLLKSQIKSQESINKAFKLLNEKMDKISKSRARDRKSVVAEQEVEVIEKSKDSGNFSELFKSNKRAITKALCELQAEKKIPGAMVTAFELYGETKLPEGIKKSVLQKADLLK